MSSEKVRVRFIQYHDALPGGGCDVKPISVTLTGAYSTTLQTTTRSYSASAYEANKIAEGVFRNDANCTVEHVAYFYPQQPGDYTVNVRFNEADAKGQMQQVSLSKSFNAMFGI